MLSVDIKTERAHSDGRGARDRTARNNWWPVAYSSDLTRDLSKPLGVKLFGEPLVLFKAEDGSISCVADVCAHNAAALSQGTVEGGQLVCRYHGWRYKKDGLCAYPRELAGKKGTTLYSYPAIDDGLMLWVYPSLDEPVEFINPLPEFTRRAGVTVSTYRPKEFLFSQPWELWAASFLDSTHREHAHPKTLVKTQRESINFLFDEAVTPAATVVFGKHDQTLGIFAYLLFSPVDENNHKQFLTLFPTSEIFSSPIAYGIFSALRLAELTWAIAYEDYYLIVKQMERIDQGASKWGIRGKYGSPVSDRFVAWHQTREQDAVWFDRYSTEGKPVLRQEAPRVAQPTGLVRDSGLDIGPYSREAKKHGGELLEPSTWKDLNLYDRAIKAVVTRVFR